MRGFASALGVRCVHCHAGKDTPNLEGVDFASDDKEEKRAARLTMRMVQAIIQDHLSQLPHATDTRVECATCHRGLARPRSIQDEVKEAMEKGGAEGAVARYRELRTSHYGDGGYDFRQGPLNALGESLVRAGKGREAAALLAVNAELHPEAAWTHYLLGEAYRVLGEMDKARASYERSATLEHDPPELSDRDGGEGDERENVQEARARAGDVGAEVDAHDGTGSEKTDAHSEEETGEPDGPRERTG
jgi:tetratricopeptide (TPR) repeat protein